MVGLRGRCFRSRHMNKYREKRTFIDGRCFASQKEGHRYQQLVILQRAKVIADLECQPVFPIHVVRLYRNGWPIEIATVAKYHADFQYTDLRTGEIVVEDVKGFRANEAYRLRKKLVEAIHGITIIIGTATISTSEVT